MNGISSKELFEFQNSTIKMFRKAIREVEQKDKLSKNALKYVDNIQSNLDNYEVMYDTLIKVREVSSKIMKSDEFEAIEGEMKVLNDTFWN